ncbi:phospholipase D-like domain-containing protein [Aliiglaciecola sp. 2_MG-2023]|uniref:phospholipase D-like domain-containing protein n=1 Tax=unclassified Aliiglaciecola TaxID=2593648 RepID=UPI0026E48595|nr:MULTISPECIES: phospholipase D-like domain-containing protein [unclassified Aliiglaciecola]MDO6713357.1 phospholipase D-like domain-containing protein [Aliiglaciecola sp. 2_MG-2023]MDO6754487.1 phospholipase D-like domain-containing protein [Aliiglaciecola sp. 1_MG-2023]
MKVSELTLNAIKPYITGDGAPTPYMSGPELIKFFNAFGLSDEYSREGLPNSWSRNEYAYERLKEVNGTPEFKKLIEAIPDSRKVNNPDKVANELSEIIKHDGYAFEKDDRGIFKVNGSAIDDPVLIAAHFQEIKDQIIESIRSAEFTIWIAVAWFTDRDIGNELRLKHQKGINVRVIVNDDEITDKHGLEFSSRGIEYKKVSPNSPWGKKLMHNKFCIIDLYKVIHGSYNWTSNAQYNNENITITESRDLAEEFSRQFIELRSQET